MFKVVYTFTGKTSFFGSLAACRIWRERLAYATMYEIRRVF